MLNEKQIALIKATVPVLQEHGVALTSHFYKRMLSGNPELRNIFNSAHQAGGEQQKALAGAVLAYAANIEDLTPLLPAVHHIAVKHCTIGIRAEQYAIVGKHLLASIREVLGDAATDELIDAWACAYGDLAKILTDAENEIYASQTAAEGSWSGWRPFRITKIVEETADVKSFTLTPSDGGKIPAFKPGQFISVRLILKEQGLAQPRQYTISKFPCTDSLRISVKKVCPANAPAGLVSNELHAKKEGDVIEVSAPLGEFVLSEGTNPVALISAGVGITPTVAMLGAAAAAPARPVVFMHVCRDLSQFPLKEEVEKLASAMPNARVLTCLTKSDAPCFHNGRPGAAQYREMGITADTDCYVCGPVPFMIQQKKELCAAGADPARIHMELFGTGSIG